MQITIVTQESFTIEDLNFEDCTDEQYGRYTFEFSTGVHDYDGYIILPPSASREDPIFDWNQSTIPNNWEDVEAYIIEQLYQWIAKEDTNNVVVVIRGEYHELAAFLSRQMLTHSNFQVQLSNVEKPIATLTLTWFHIPGSSEEACEFVQDRIDINTLEERDLDISVIQVHSNTNN